MKKLLLLIPVFLLILSELFASTGKLTGTVKDKKTGEPVIGANIILEGTYLGAAANLDGEFTIYNIPVGEYRIVCSAVGYQKMVISKVIIKNNLTTTQNLLMTSEDIFLDQEIVVEAQAPLIQKDLTSSSVTVTASELKAMPVENIGQVVNMQAGVVDGHFRGGRSNEVAYLIDGVPITDAFNNSQSIQVENSSIRQLEVISGTFNAEYGQAMSGVVNIVTNDGSLTGYSSNFQGYLGSYYSTDKLYPNVDRITGLQSRDLQASFSGPVPLLSNTSFFVTGRYFKDDGYFYGRKIYNPEDASPLNRPAVVPSGDSSWVSMAPNRFYTLNSKLTVAFPSFKVSLNTFFDDHESQGYNHSKKYAPLGRMVNYRTNLINTLQFTHIPNESLFHVTSFSLNLNNYKGYAYEDISDDRYVSPNYGSPPGGDLFWKGGTENSRYSRFTNTAIVKWALTSQLNDEHKIGIGAEGKFYHLYTRNQFLNALEEDTSSTPDGIIDVVTFYFPPLHQDGNQGYRKIPYEYSAYIQDKMEYDIMIINVGVRADYFQPNTKVVSDLKNPNRNNLYPGAGPMKDAETQFQISPRFGVSFPITAEGVIHFSYGHFFQIPPFESIYANEDLPVYLNQLGSSYGNGNLKAQKTVMYELGLQQVLPFEVKLDANMYYRDIRNLIGVEVINTYAGSYYSRFINKDYGNVRGFIMSLDKRLSENFSAAIDYTFQQARGNASDPYQAIYYYNSNLEPEKLVRPLDWDQRHTLNLNLTVRDETWSVGTFISYGSGLPFTPDVIYTNGFRFLNDGVKPATWNLDVRAEKSFFLGDTRISTFLLVYNLLGLKNEYGVFSSTGRATRDLTGEQQTRPVVGDAIFYDNLNDPGRFSAPRNIKLGLSFSL